MTQGDPSKRGLLTLVLVGVAIFVALGLLLACNWGPSDSEPPRPEDDPTWTVVHKSGFTSKNVVPH